MSARAGLRVGAGLVTLFSPPSAVLVNASHETAVMVNVFSDPGALKTLTTNTQCTLIGPGAGLTPDTFENTLAVLDGAASAVLDADALTMFKDQPERLFSAINRPVLITPHEGEFRRVFPDLPVSSNRIDAVSRAAKQAGAVIIPKGPASLIASPDGRLVKNTHASPFLATAGSGDVLAGIAGGLMAQGMDVFHAACAACWVHGELGLRLGPGMISEDLPDALPVLLKELYASRA